MNDGLPGPKWNWGKPDFTKKKKSPEEVLREKYPSVYKPSLSEFYRKECWDLPFKKAWMKVRAAQQSGMITYDGDLSDKERAKGVFYRIKRKSKRMLARQS